MFRPLTRMVLQTCMLLALAGATTLSAFSGPDRTEAAGDQDGRAGGGAAGEPTPAAWLPAGRVTLIVHGVNDDGKDWSPRIKNALIQSPYGDSRQEVYLFRWTQPDGTPPALCHARNSLSGLEARYPDDPETEAGYQVAEARRLRDFLTGARALYREYGVDGRIDVVAHSQGTLIALKALELGSDADNVVFLGSPLLYTGDRQDDVLAALPHIRGVLYNYYTPSDRAIRFMGGLLLYEPRGWPETDLPKDKVVQVRLDVQGHTGYYTQEAIRANYLDKVGVREGEGCRLPVDRAREFTEKWRNLTAAARLSDPG